MAVESDATEARFAPTTRKSSGKRGAAAAPFRPADFIRNDCPALCVIPPQLWKHLLAACVGLLLGAGLLAGGYHEAAWAKKLGPGFGRLCSLSQGTLVGWYSEALLIGASQAALLIRWARSRSLKDFAGGYQIWGWTAGLWLLLSVCLATGAHRAWSETLIFLWPEELKGHATFCWLAPTVLIANWLLIRLQQEMGACPLSRWTFVLAILLYCGAGVVYLRGESVGRLVGEDLGIVVLDGFLLAGHITLLLSMTLHARHVLYINAEPPARPGSKSAARWFSLGAALTGWWRALFATKPRTAKASDKGESTSKATAKRTRRKPAARKAAVAAAVESEPEADEVEETEDEVQNEAEAEEAPDEVSDEEAADGAEEEAEVEASSEEGEEESEYTDEDESEGRHYRYDASESGGAGPHGNQKAGADPFKGLSKRERRKLQQQMRDQERDQRHGR